MGYKSRVNGLNLNPSKTGDKGAVAFTTNLGNLGAKVVPLKASNNPGPATAPSSQGPIMPGSKPATGVTPRI